TPVLPRGERGRDVYRLAFKQHVAGLIHDAGDWSRLRRLATRRPARRAAPSQAATLHPCQNFVRSCSYGSLPSTALAGAAAPASTDRATSTETIILMTEVPYANNTTFRVWR